MAAALRVLYPGEDRVDLIAVDCYNFGTSQSWSSWIRPAALFDPTFATVRGLAPGKPLMLCEVGSSELGGDKAAWNRELLEWTAAQPDLDGLTAYRNGEVDSWIEPFRTATVQATDLAASYLDEVARLTERWRDMLRAESDPLVLTRPGRFSR